MRIPGAWKKKCPLIPLLRLKTNMNSWKITIFHRRYIFKGLVFQPVMLLFRGDSACDLSVAKKNTRRICLSFFNVEDVEKLPQWCKKKTWNISSFKSFVCEIQLKTDVLLRCRRWKPRTFQFSFCFFNRPRRRTSPFSGTAATRAKFGGIWRKAT